MNVQTYMFCYVCLKRYLLVKLDFYYVKNIYSCYFSNSDLPDKRYIPRNSSNKDISWIRKVIKLQLKETDKRRNFWVLWWGKVKKRVRDYFSHMNTMRTASTLKFSVLQLTSSSCWFAIHVLSQKLIATLTFYFREINRH